MLTLIWIVSLVLCLVSLAVMLTLIARRVLITRRTRHDGLLRRRLIGELIAFTDQGDPDALRPVLRTTAPRLALDAGFEFLGLLRGESYDRIVSVFVEAGLPAQIRGVLARGDEAERLHAVEMLAITPGEHGVEALTRTLARDRSSEVRLAAAMSLADLGALPPLDEVLSRIGPQGRRSRRLVDLFRRLSHEHARELEACAADMANPVPLRAAAVEALGESGDPRLHEFLLARASEADAEVAAAAIRSLGRTGGPRSQALVREALGHASWQVRACAAEAAERLGGADAVESLSNRLDDAVWAVRYAAGKALRRLGADGETALRAAAAGGTPRQQRTAALILAEGLVA